MEDKTIQRLLAIFKYVFGESYDGSKEHGIKIQALAYFLNEEGMTVEGYDTFMMNDEEL